MLLTRALRTAAVVPIAGCLTAAPAGAADTQTWNLAADLGSFVVANPGPSQASVPDSFGNAGVWSFMKSATLAHDANVVNDFVRHKTIVLHAGQSYLARATHRSS